jgi:hypothetical protein
MPVRMNRKQANVRSLAQPPIGPAKPAAAADPAPVPVPTAARCWYLGCGDPATVQKPCAHPVPAGYVNVWICAGHADRLRAAVDLTAGRR